MYYLEVSFFVVLSNLLVFTSMQVILHMFTFNNLKTASRVLNIKLPYFFYLLTIATVV